jgi:hypothetical protein
VRVQNDVAFQQRHETGELSCREKCRSGMGAAEKVSPHLNCGERSRDKEVRVAGKRVESYKSQRAGTEPLSAFVLA